jgi:hypothetical protein
MGKIKGELLITLHHNDSIIREIYFIWKQFESVMLD